MDKLPKEIIQKIYNNSSIEFTVNTYKCDEFCYDTRLRRKVVT
jgi:hypothetical protein